MGKWKQVSGDMSFDSHGCTIANIDKKNRSVDLVRITPWLEMDSSALKEGYGFWDVQETTIDYDDMSIKNEEVVDALRSAGMSPAEYKELDPASKAVVITDYNGFDDGGHSVNDFSEALPVDINAIAWWANGPHDVKAINQEMRYEVTNKIYGGDYKDEVPDDDALEMAMGDEEVVIDLNADEAQALRYAMAVAAKAYTWGMGEEAKEKKITVTSVDEMKVLLNDLFSAPEASDLPSDKLELLVLTYRGSFEMGWSDPREQAIYMIDEDAKGAHDLGNNILQKLGL